MEPSAKRVRFGLDDAAEQESAVVAVEDATIAMALDDLADLDPALDWSGAVAGPDLVSITAVLRARPSEKKDAVVPLDDGMEEARASLIVHQQAVEDAKADHVATEGMSQRLRKLTADALSVAETLMTSQAALVEEKAKTLSPQVRTYADWDKKRALAAANLADWETRVDRRRQSMASQVDSMLELITDASEALAMQRDDLMHQHKAYGIAWDVAEAVTRAAHEGKVAELTRQTVAVAPTLATLAAPPLTPPATLAPGSSAAGFQIELDRMRVLVKELESRLEQQVQHTTSIMKDAEARHSSTVEGWTRHCAGLTAETSLLKSALPPQAAPLSAEETTARASAAAAVRKDQEAVVESAGAEAMQTAEENAQQHY